MWLERLAQDKCYTPGERDISTQLNDYAEVYV